MRRKRDDPLPPLDASARKRLRAVVLDTNCLGREGNPVLSTLRWWSDLCLTNGLELWVPEPVLLEWAEHVATAYEAVQRAASDDRKTLRDAGVPPPTWPFAERGDVIAYVNSTVRGIPGVIVVPLGKEEAHAAVIDQLLQRPPASRKHGVKTGAGDSAWLRGTFRKAGKDFSRVLVVTGDHAAVDGIAHTLGTAPPHVARNFTEAHELLGLLDPMDEGETWTLVAALAHQLALGPAHPHTVTERVVDADLFAASDLVDVAGGRVEEDLEPFVQDATLVDVYDLAGVGQVERLTANTVAAEVYALGKVAVSTAGYNADGETLHDEQEYGGFLVTATLLIEIDAAGRIVAAENADGTVEVRGADTTVRSLRQGLLVLDEALETLPGLVPPAWTETADTAWSRSVNGHTVEIRIEHSAGSWRTVTRVDDETVATLTCEPNRHRDRFGDDFTFSVDPMRSWEDPNPPWDFAAMLRERIAR